MHVLVQPLLASLNFATEGQHRCSRSGCHDKRGSTMVSLYSMYREGCLPRAAYHCMTKGGIQIASPAWTGYLHSQGPRLGKGRSSCPLPGSNRAHDLHSMLMFLFSMSCRVLPVLTMRNNASPGQYAAAPIRSVPDRLGLCYPSILPLPWICRSRLTSCQLGGRCPALVAAASHVGCSAAPAPFMPCCSSVCG